jgi:amidase
LNFLEARVLARMLRSSEVSATEVLEACLDQIDRCNPVVNAVPTLRDRDELIEEAHAADRQLRRGADRGPLYGLPIVLKDLTSTRGLRTTFGSLLYRDFVPDADDLIVDRLRAAGAIVIGKTNTPEFGAGSQTFNKVFGATSNPYQPAMTCGGSSGGAAAALACGMAPLADGSDLGGSLRNPASFCNVVGFRPSPGRVPRLAPLGWEPLSVQGPMARTVADTAMLLSVIAGPDVRDPIALEDPGTLFAGRLSRSFKDARLAWSENLGRYPVEPHVTRVCNGSRGVFEALGCRVEDAEPDFSGADEIFRILRAALFAARLGEQLEQCRAMSKDTVVREIERGLQLSAMDVSRAEARRTALYRRVSEFFGRYRFLILPVSQVAPFPLDVEWVREIDGVRMSSYIDWMATCYVISCVGLPAISVPCGFTPQGLPIGLQIVGPPRRDFEVLQLAHAFEQATGHGRRRPPLATEPAP